MLVVEAEAAAASCPASPAEAARETARGGTARVTGPEAPARAASSVRRAYRHANHRHANPAVVGAAAASGAQGPAEHAKEDAAGPGRDAEVVRRAARSAEHAKSAAGGAGSEAGVVSRAAGFAGHANRGSGPNRADNIEWPHVERDAGRGRSAGYRWGPGDALHGCMAALRRCLHGGSKRAAVDVALPLHLYDRGVRRNFAEVLFPDHALRCALAAKQRCKDS